MFQINVSWHDGRRYGRLRQRVIYCERVRHG